MDEEKNKRGFSGLSSLASHLSSLGHEIQDFDVMIIDCPECGVQFRLDAQLLEPRGRRLRCSGCQSVWFQDRPQDTASPAQGARSEGQQAAPYPEPPLDGFDARRRTPRTTPLPKPVRKTRGGGLFAMLVLVLVVGGTGAGLWYGRKDIVTFEPRAMILYDLVGMTVFPVGEGLDLVDMKTERGRGEAGESLVVISGQIENVTPKAIVIPRLQASLLDADGQALTRKTLKLEQEALAPGQKQAFRVPLTSAEGASNVVIIFVSDDQAAKEQDFEPKP